MSRSWNVKYGIRNCTSFLTDFTSWFLPWGFSFTLPLALLQESRTSTLSYFFKCFSSPSYSSPSFFSLFLQHRLFCLFVTLVDVSPSILYNDIGMWPTVYPRISIRSGREESEEIFWNYVCLLPNHFFSPTTKKQKKSNAKMKKYVRNVNGSVNITTTEGNVLVW